MRGQVETLLEQGVEAAQAGEEERARNILIRVIELDQRNEQAWLWLSSVVETTIDKTVCLENVLVINPDNTSAATGLQRLRQQPMDGMAPSPLFPRLTSPRTSAKWAWGASAAETSPSLAQRVCPRCGFRNPGWAYLCDRCGTDLRHVDIREALGPASRPRGRSFITLLEAWGAAFTFNRSWTFLPEIELASWGRSLMALVMAALFASAWRVALTVALGLRFSQYDPRSQLPTDALRCAVQVPLLTLTLALVCAPVALLTWVGARLLGGRRDLKTHAHLTAVALSVWIVLVALLTTLVPYLSGHVRGIIRIRPYLNLLCEGMSAFAGVVGFVWLAQALRTAHQLSAARAILVTLAVAALGAAFFLGLDRFTGGQLTALVSTLVTIFSLPLPD